MGGLHFSPITMTAHVRSSHFESRSVYSRGERTPPEPGLAASLKARLRVKSEDLPAKPGLAERLKGRLAVTSRGSDFIRIYSGTLRHAALAYKINRDLQPARCFFWLPGGDEQNTHSTSGSTGRVAVATFTR